MPARVCPFLIEIATTVFWGSVMNPFGSHYFVIRFHEMNTPHHALYLLLRSIQFRYSPELVCLTPCQSEIVEVQISIKLVLGDESKILIPVGPVGRRSS